MRGLSGKAAIVTGGASGIGKAISQRLAEEGCKVGIFDLNGDGAEAAAADIRGKGGEAYPHTVDVTDYQAVAGAVSAFEGETGVADILINNAGWDRTIPFLDTDLDFWEKVIALNLRGPLNLHHVVLPRMQERGEGGKVVNIASDAGRVGSSGEAVYSACKGGLIAFTKTMAREMARHQINLNAVCPGPTDTPLLASSMAGEAGAKIAEAMKRAIPFRRFGKPEDLAGTVAYLASADADYITGQVMSVSGGLTMVG